MLLGDLFRTRLLEMCASLDFRVRVLPFFPAVDAPSREESRTFLELSLSDLVLVSSGQTRQDEEPAHLNKVNFRASNTLNGHISRRVEIGVIADRQCMLRD